MKNTVVTTFRMPVSLRVDAAYRDSEAIFEFNNYHTGKTVFPFDEDVPLSKTGAKMQDLHHHLFSSYSAEIVVEVLEDGTLRVKADQSTL